MTETHDAFELTEDHVKLLRRSYVYGAANCIAFLDQKRPFGNSDIVRDVVDILGWETIETDDGEFALPKGTSERANLILSQLSQALQVILSSGSFEPGVYRSKKYRNEWSRA